MLQIVTAFKEIEDAGVAHRDITDLNILVCPDKNTQCNKVKIIDYGCGALLDERPYPYWRGSKDYATPEWFQTEQGPTKPYLVTESAVWSLGVILYSMMYGEHPFRTDNEIMYEEVYFPSRPFIENNCKDLIKKCLDKAPTWRPSYDQILQHAWLTEVKLIMLYA